MDVINFDCLRCGQNLEAPSTMAGMVAKCPGCGGEVQILSPDQPIPSRDKSATVQINVAALGGIPPEPPPRRIIVKRASEKK